MTQVRRKNLGDGLVQILIDRPDKLNALTLDMMAELRAAIEDVRADPSVTALLLCGSGRAFCTGRDLSDAQPGEDAYAILHDHINGLVSAVYDLEIPTIAAVRGPIMGVGLGLALACDIVVAGHSAAISSPFARLGAALDSGGHFFLARAIGSHRALDLVYSGLPIAVSPTMRSMASHANARSG
jgi:2-(1,2-epoxy-1,2-dihydrophenyl)acetyl-CoA isomerase